MSTERPREQKPCSSGGLTCITGSASVKAALYLAEAARRLELGAYQLAAGSAQPAVARADCLAQHPADVDLLAHRPQRLQPPGARPDRRDALQARHCDAH